jgi:PAS domain-containing protein
VLLHPPEEVVNLPAQREAILSLNTDDFPHHQVIRELLRRDGTRARYHGSLSFSRGPAGEPLWCCTLVDLSALDGLRNQLSEQTGLAGTMRQRFDRFSSLSDDGIAIVSRATGRIEHANESLCALLGRHACACRRSRHFCTRRRVDLVFSGYENIRRKIQRRRFERVAAHHQRGFALRRVGDHLIQQRGEGDRRFDEADDARAEAVSEGAGCERGDQRGDRQAGELR